MKTTPPLNCDDLLSQPGFNRVERETLSRIAERYGQDINAVRAVLVLKYRGVGAGFLRKLERRGWIGNTPTEEQSAAKKQVKIEDLRSRLVHINDSIAVSRTRIQRLKKTAKAIQQLMESLAD